jgi:hypothetical protein
MDGKAALNSRNKKEDSLRTQLGKESNEEVKIVDAQAPYPGYVPRSSWNFWRLLLIYSFGSAVIPAIVGFGLESACWTHAGQGAGLGREARHSMPMSRESGVGSTATQKMSLTGEDWWSRYIPSAGMMTDLRLTSSDYSRDP